MDEVHTGIAEWRRSHQSDPIPAVTKPLLETILGLLSEAGLSTG